MSVILAASRWNCNSIPTYIFYITALSTRPQGVHGDSVTLGPSYSAPYKVSALLSHYIHLIKAH